MTKRSRTILFLFLGAVFLLGTPTIILYSQGYRFDWQERRFSQVGAFYFNINPARVEVFVNDQFMGRTTRILGTTLTKNFLPGIYLIRIEKEEYHPWEKRLQIFPRQVTEAKNVVLIPKDPIFIHCLKTNRSFCFLQLVLKPFCKNHLEFSIPNQKNCSLASKKRCCLLTEKRLRSPWEMNYGCIILKRNENNLLDRKENACFSQGSARALAILHGSPRTIFCSRRATLL